MSKLTVEIPESLQRSIAALAKQALAAKLVQGLDSGKPASYAPGHFRARKAALVKRVGQGAKGS